MANAKGHLKLTGDTHLPDAESDLAIEEGASSLARLARERTQPGRANTVRRAGLLRDQDDATSDDGTAAQAVEDAGDAAMPSADAAGPMATACRQPAKTATASSAWGPIALGVAGAWLLLKLLRS
ncbi:hypothetical protein [Ramlibacter algicola]|uniref:Uncharacterized protein n=1 Tax=Ramlibacter algicola TaxID=2795217 RepID=A0A934UQ73_9BURK|nr:hypothetical protein [Ramlibacter algicola]MBK0391825.1 hypothetical protein [Ramlibacter algicola]